MDFFSMLPWFALMHMTQFVQLTHVISVIVNSIGMSLNNKDLS